MSQSSHRLNSLSSGTPIEDDEPITTRPLVQRPPEEEPGREGRSAEDLPRPAGRVLNSNVTRLAEKFKPEDDKKGVCFRLPPWLVRMINQHIFELKGRGYKITKEALAEDAFMKYFGLKTPPSQ